MFDQDFILIKTCDGKIHEVNISVAMVSVKLKNMLENLRTSKSGNPQPKQLELEEIDSPTFEMIVEWCKHHVDDPNVDKEVEVDEEEDYDFPDWDEDWIDSLNEERLFSVILAANHLGLTMLMELGSKRVASTINTLSVEEMRQRFGLKNDLPPNEERRLRKRFELFNLLD